MEVIKYNQPNAFYKKPLPFSFKGDADVQSFNNMNVLWGGGNEIKQQSEFIADSGEQRSDRICAISYNMVSKTKDE